MNKSQLAQANQARAVTDTMPDYAARTLAALHRSANKKAQAEIVALVAELGLSAHLTVVNGCLVEAA